jgi:predicted phosphodiesterase
MAIVVGDIHGNVEKVRAFLDYKPEEQHIALGDYLDSFTEPQILQILTLQLLVDSSAVLLWGNHDLHYLRTPPWWCTGFQHGKEEPLIVLIEAYKYRFKAAVAVDGWLCTHAGVHVCVARPKRCDGNVDRLAKKLNEDMLKFLQKPEIYQWASGMRPSPAIFKIGQGRGGSNGDFGGIFWHDYKREPGLAHVPQIFGHSEGKEPVRGENRILGEFTPYICLDTTNNQNDCWVFDTATGELVSLPLKRRAPMIGGGEHD